MTTRAEAHVSEGAIERNCAHLAAVAAGAKLCAVVKADGYGHGATGAARAALAGGASMLAVATANEAQRIRDEFPDASIFLMGALSADELDLALHSGAELSIWREGFRRLVAERAAQLGVKPRVHVKFDSGMGRLGERDAQATLALADAVANDEDMDLAAIWTHFATADAKDSFYAKQLAAFTSVAEKARAAHPAVEAHAANSAATLADPESHFDMVRCGVAIYGLDPFGRDPAEQGLEPALELRSYVTDVKTFEAGASAGYGQSWTADVDTSVGVVPVGYGDGYRRALSNRAEVLIGGRRYPVVGTVSMDNLTVDLGPRPLVSAGDEVTLLGAQGEERILAEELAEKLDTINYEVVVGVTQRVGRLWDS